MRYCSTILLLSLAATPALGQDTTAAGTDSTLRVFFDCQGFGRGCDFDFMRTEIAFVDWVRQREDADVHILITTQETGGGGRAHSLAFIGVGRFGERVDTLQYFSGPADTEDDVRRGLARVIKLGLISYVAKTPAARAITLSYAAPARAAARVHDPWDYWFFRVNVNGFLNGEKLIRFINLFGNISANRVTEDWKFQFNVSPSYNEGRFIFQTLDSAGTVVAEDTTISIARSYGASALLARSLTRHWSFGGRVEANRSTRRNHDLAIGAGPAIEYDIYPYTESTRRLLTLTYSVTLNHFDYTDTTIYDKTEETLARQSLNVSLQVSQPWGSMRLFLEGSSHLDNIRRNRVELFGGVDVRLFRGLSFEVQGSVERVRDQINLPKAGASQTEVLLQRRELETSYRYFTFFGLSYTFGSKYNNIVNPRFDVF
ncbi:MAG: hypothetical protein ACREMN_13670 [Gemmatimonadales bacterium]